MIIGLHGKLRSGKDTACQIIADNYERGIVLRKAFADPLKLSAARIFKPDATLEEALDFCNKLKEQGYVDVVVDAGEGKHLTGRQFLQNYGTEAHRDVFGTNFWVDASLPRYDDIRNSERTVFQIDRDKDIVVFTDVRFPNEAERIHEWGGVVIEIYRDAHLRGVSDDNHASEVSLPRKLINFSIPNNGTLDDLGAILNVAIDSAWSIYHREATV